MTSDYPASRGGNNRRCCIAFPAIDSDHQSVPKRRWSSIDQNFASDSPVEVNGLFALIAQLDSALAYEARGSGFESRSGHVAAVMLSDGQAEDR